jgi:hypothetical protein
MIMKAKLRNDIWKIGKELEEIISATSENYQKFKSEEWGKVIFRIYEDPEIEVYKKRSATRYRGLDPKVCIVFPALKKAIVIQKWIDRIEIYRDEGEVTIETKTSLGFMHYPNKEEAIESEIAGKPKPERKSNYYYDLSMDYSNDWGYATEKYNSQILKINPKTGKGVINEIEYFTLPHYTWCE